MKKDKNQFSGLEIGKLIGAPLQAAADADRQLANSAADFISKVEFDADKKVKKESSSHNS